MIRHPAPLLLAVALAASTLVACARETPKPEIATPTPTPTPTASMGAGAGPAVVATPTGTDSSARSTATPTPTPTAVLPAAGIAGLFNDPRPSSAKVRSLGPVPPLSLAHLSRESRAYPNFDVTLFDVRQGVERVLGQGEQPVFSPDGTQLAWLTVEVPLNPRAGAPPSKIVTFDLATGQRGALGLADYGDWWLEQGTRGLLVYSPGRAVFDVTTGAVRGFEAPSRTMPTAWEAAGYRLERVRTRPRRPPGATSPRDDRSTYIVRDLATNAEFGFDAYTARISSDGAIIMATIPTPVPTSTPDPYLGPPLAMNVFEVDPRTRQATFIASTVAMSSWTLEVSARHVMWQADGCTLSKTWFYDRRVRETVELSEPLGPARFTPSGLVAVGDFGAKTLIDPATLSYTVALPHMDVSWSPDYRYVAVGPLVGHGGRCP